MTSVEVLTPADFAARKESALSDPEASRVSQRITGLVGSYPCFQIPDERPPPTVAPSRGHAGAPSYQGQGQYHGHQHGHHYHGGVSSRAQHDRRSTAPGQCGGRDRWEQQGHPRWRQQHGRGGSERNSNAHHVTGDASHIKPARIGASEPLSKRATLAALNKLTAQNFDVIRHKLIASVTSASCSVDEVISAILTKCRVEEGYIYIYTSMLIEIAKISSDAMQNVHDGATAFAHEFIEVNKRNSSMSSSPVVQDSVVQDSSAARGDYDEFCAMIKAKKRSICMNKAVLSFIKHGILHAVHAEDYMMTLLRQMEAALTSRRIDDVELPLDHIADFGRVFPEEARSSKKLSDALDVVVEKVKDVPKLRFKAMDLAEVLVTKHAGNRVATSGTPVVPNKSLHANSLLHGHSVHGNSVHGNSVHGNSVHANSHVNSNSNTNSNTNHSRTTAERKSVRNSSHRQDDHKATTRHQHPRTHRVHAH